MSVGGREYHSIWTEETWPDFLVSTRRFTTETGGVNGTLGDSEEYFWETPEEKDAFQHIENTTRAREHAIPPEAFAGNYEGPLYAPHPDLKWATWNLSPTPREQEN